MMMGPVARGTAIGGAGEKISGQGRSGINCVNASALLVFHHHVTSMSDGGQSLVGRSREERGEIPCYTMSRHDYGLKTESTWHFCNKLGGGESREPKCRDALAGLNGRRGAFIAAAIP